MSAAILTPLSTLINRMNRFQVIETVEEQYKVRDIDEAIRELRQETLFPWTLKKSTLRVFDDVLIYPTASDHDEIAFFDNNSKSFSLKPRTKFTTLKEFLENPSTQNDLTEVWDSGIKMIGLRYNSGDTTSQVLSDAEDEDLYAVSDDATAIGLEGVVVNEGNSSVRVTIVNTTNLATITNTFSSFSDSNYKQKYHFRKIYLAAVPTSIKMRLRSSAGNYLETTVTTQFSGQAFKANDWNIIAHDLNTANETGTFNYNTISSEQIVLVGASSGTYYLDTSSYKGWELLDYWYYSRYLVATDGATTPNQEYFFNSSEQYETDSALLAESEWISVFLYTAMFTTVADKESNPITAFIQNKLVAAQKRLYEQHPHLKPFFTTSRYAFITDPMQQFYGTNFQE